MAEAGEPQTQRSSRRKLLWILAVVGLGFAVHLLLPQVGQLQQTLRTLRHGSPWWMAGVVTIAVLGYACAAVALQASTSAHLRFGRTMAVQVAASFMNRLAPASLGGIGLNARYLEKSGVSRGAITAAIGTNAAAGFALHVALLIPAVVLSGVHGMAGDAHRPPRWSFLVVGLLLLVGSGIILSPALRSRLARPATDAARELWATLRSPRRAFLLLGGCLGVTLSNIAALAAALAAYGAHTPLEHVALTYLLASAVSSAAPTPGGLGAMEAALVATLTALGVESAPAIAGVLTFRLATFWMPILPGWLCFRVLRRKGAL